MTKKDLIEKIRKYISENRYWNYGDTGNGGQSVIPAEDLEIMLDLSTTTDSQEADDLIYNKKLLGYDEEDGIRCEIRGYWKDGVCYVTDTINKNIADCMHILPLHGDTLDSQEADGEWIERLYNQTNSIDPITLSTFKQAILSSLPKTTVPNVLLYEQGVIEGRRQANEESQEADGEWIESLIQRILLTIDEIIRLKKAMDIERTANGVQQYTDTIVSLKEGIVELLHNLPKTNDKMIDELIEKIKLLPQLCPDEEGRKTIQATVDVVVMYIRDSLKSPTNTDEGEKELSDDTYFKIRYEGERVKFKFRDIQGTGKSATIGMMTQEKEGNKICCVDCDEGGHKVFLCNAKPI